MCGVGCIDDVLFARKTQFFVCRSNSWFEPMRVCVGCAENSIVGQLCLCSSFCVFVSRFLFRLPCPPLLAYLPSAAHLVRRAHHRRGPPNGGGQRREAASGVPAPLRLQLPHHPREGEAQSNSIGKKRRIDKEIKEYRLEIKEDRQELRCSRVGLADSRTCGFSVGETRCLSLLHRWCNAASPWHFQRIHK